MGLFHHKQEENQMLRIPIEAGAEDEAEDAGTASAAQAQPSAAETPPNTDQEQVDGSGDEPRESAPDAPAEPVATAPEPVSETSPEALPESPSWQEQIVPDRFKGKTVIVTGAGSGIGRATASRIAREGGRVIAADISEDRLNDFRSSLPDADIITISGDIVSDDTVSHIADIAGEVVDGLANVAGIMDNFTPLHEMDDDVWWRVLNVNLVGVMKLSRAVLPKMLTRKGGAIVNVGSEATLKASAAGAAYTTSKHAVAGLSKSMAFMYGPSGIRTNVVAPGAVLTDIEAKPESQLGEERTGRILATIPKPADASQLAAAITFLLSDDAANINGAVLPSDGGWSVQ